MRTLWLLAVIAIDCAGGEGSPRSSARPGAADTARPAKPAPSAASAPAALPATSTAAASAPVVPRLTAGLEIPIPAGLVRAGSATGSPGRNPSSEADGLPIEIPAFTMDALPYPNDPAVPPRTEVDRAQAQALCREQGKRLCHELEWERACEGDADSAFPGTLHPFDASACARDLASCTSPFGVVGLGVFGREWTSSQTTRGLGDALRKAVVRGAARDAEATLHRCASRDAATPDSKSASLTFRCCRGDAPSASLAYPEEPERSAFVMKPLSGPELTERLTRVKEWQEVAGEFRPFSEREVDEGLRAAGTSRLRMAPWLAAASVLHWSPLHGEEALVLSGDTPRGATLLAAYLLPDGELRSIAMFVTTGEHTPIVLGYKPDAPSELLFSSCWGCGGEGGALIASAGQIQLVPR